MSLSRPTKETRPVLVEAAEVAGVVPAVLVDRQRRLLGVVVVAHEPGRPAHDQLAGLADADVLAGLGVEIVRISMSRSGRPLVVDARLERVVRLAEAGERARLGAAEAGDLRRVRQALLHREQRRRARRR